MKSHRWGKFPFHPLLWGALPLMIFFVSNISEVKPNVLWRPLGISILFVMVIFGLLTAFIRDWHQSALIASWFLMLFFTYGHIYTLLKEVTFFTILLGRHRLLIPVWLFLLIGGWVFIVRKIKSYQAWTLILNATLLIFLAFQGIQIGIYFLKSSNTQVDVQSDYGLQYSSSQPLPDVYVIILDAYARADVLENYYDFDNSGFLNALEEQQFEIVPCARGNYEHTVLAMPSLLNMEYMDGLTDDSANEHQFRALLSNNRVRRLLEDLGYRFFTYEMQIHWLEIPDSDVYFDFKASRQFKFLQPFEMMYLETTWGLAVVDVFAVRTQQVLADLRINSPRALKAELELARLDALKQTIHHDGPKLVYVHFMLPHPPYVFDAKGGLIEGEVTSTQGYVWATQFINSRIMPLIDEILVSSEGDAIIVLQSDHGWEDDYRWLILNAIHFSEQRGDLGIYPGMTPVNTFRLIFNQAFEADFPLLKDKFFESDESWFTHWEIDVQDPYCDIKSP